MKKFTTTALVALFFVVGLSTVKAQSPDGQFGVGGAIGDVTGAQLQYAISPAFHLGTRVGVTVRDSNTALVLGPYVKFIFAGSKEFKPYLMAMLALVNPSVDLTQMPGSSTYTSLNIGAGGEYFATPNIGIFFGISVVSIPFEKAPNGPFVEKRAMAFGILMPTIGVEWFM